MKYKIKIFYKTGNSFGSREEIDYVNYEWENYEMASESLERIKNHYYYYQENSDEWTKPEGKLPEGVVWDNKHRHISLELLDDNGKPYMFSPFWTGYFERLLLAEIVIETARFEPGWC